MSALQALSAPQIQSKEPLYAPLVKTVMSGVTAHFGHVLTPKQFEVSMYVCRRELHAFVFGERYREHREACLLHEDMFPIVLREVILSCVEQIRARTETVH